MTSKRKYKGQILAVVLVILVVGVLIALAMMSRVGSDTRITQEENYAADALEISDSILDSVKGLDITELATWASTYSECNPTNDLNYDIFTQGCTLSFDGLYDLLDHFSLLRYYDSILSSLQKSCNYENAPDVTNLDGAKVVIDQVSSNQEVVIEKDQVFSLVLRAPPSSNCSLNVYASAVDGTSDAAIVYNAVYTTLAGGKITSYRPYSVASTPSGTETFFGQCLTSSCDIANNWYPADISGTTTNSFNISSGDGYGLYELRMRAIHYNVEVRREYVDLAPGGCDTVSKDDMMALSALVNCGLSERGKMFVLTKESWAPAIFDYVLFNGNGPLELQ